MKKQLPKIVVILGPTSTGKSDLAVLIAREFGGEIISADSRQVYRGLDIGAGKITKQEMKGIPHHLLDIASPASKRYTAENFTKDAERAARDIVARGKLPIVCGGTGFYIDAFLHGGSFPPVKPDQKLRTKLSKKTTEELMRELRKLDPRRAKEIDPNNKVRIIRSIEIARAIGSVPPPKREERYETLSIGLFDDREKMHERIHTRLIKRIKLGMAREVSHLHAKGVSWKRLHEFGLEYRYLALYLQGLMKKEEMLAKLEQEIFNFSKRQMTWFKRDKSIHWIKPGQTTAARKLIARFLK